MLGGGEEGMGTGRRYSVKRGLNRTSGQDTGEGWGGGGGGGG